MPTFHANVLIDFVRALAVAADTPEDIAQYVAESLVSANMLGHDSHGVIRTKYYMRDIQREGLLPDERPEIAKQTGATAVIDCRRGWGQIGARYGAEVARDLAREHGIGCVALSECNHIGRLGPYAEWLAGEGQVGIVLTGIPGKGTTPYGGREAIFGTNPMAWAVPTSDGPMVLDFATSAVAAGKLMVAADEGKPVPPGWLLDKDGNPTTDPHALWARAGCCLPFGGYKGYGLNLMVGIIPIILAGSAPTFSEEARPGNPTIILALSIEAFTDYDRYIRLTDELRQRVRLVEPAVGFDEVLLPGDLEARSLAARTRDGIPLADRTWEELGSSWAQEWGVPVP